MFLDDEMETPAASEAEGTTDETPAMDHTPAADAGDQESPEQEGSEAPEAA